MRLSISFSRLWIKVVAGGDLSLSGNDIYHIDPPRPRTFWQTAHTIELGYNLIIPTVCVLACEAGIHDFVVACVLDPTM